jgi:hypothetical protein
MIVRARTSFLTRTVKNYQPAEESEASIISSSHFAMSADEIK